MRNWDLDSDARTCEDPPEFDVLDNPEQFRTDELGHVERVNDE